MKRTMKPVMKIAAHMAVLMLLPLATFAQGGGIRGPIASFIDRIALINRIITQKQMSWIHALRCITRMAYLLIHWDWAKVNHPRKAMRLFNSISSSPKTTISISSLAVNAANPEPTILSFINEFPKSFFWRSRSESSSMRNIARMATEFPSRILRRSKYAFAL